MTTLGPASGSLQSLGFTEYEARVYVTLLQRGPLTGYEIAKTSNIPRPNVYPLLDRLQRRGAVTRVEGKRAKLYAAIPASDMLASLGRTMETQLSEARRELSKVKRTEPSEFVLNIEGYEQVLEKATAMVDATERRLIVGLWSAESRLLMDAFERAQVRGVSISTLCIQGCADECGGCRGSIYRYPVATGSANRWLLVVSDESLLLTGQMSTDNRAVAATTNQEVFVGMATQYLLNAIAASEITRSLGGQLPELLDERAREALKGTGLAVGGASWLGRMLDVVRRAQP